VANNLDREKLKESLAFACRWITTHAMNHDDTVADEVNEWKYDFSSWKGCMREYNAREKRWMAYGPHWHTGQAVKALILAYRALGDKSLLASAKEGAGFILRERIKNPQDPDYGALLAYEADGGAGALIANTAGMFESLDGLFFLGEELGDKKYPDAASAALNWIERRAYLPEEGLFYERFSLKDRRLFRSAGSGLRGFPGRPIIDDGVFLKGYYQTKKDSFRKIFFETADRILREEMPPGNWIKFIPCNLDKGSLHPRQAFWFGRPMVMAWKEAQIKGQEYPEKYLNCAKRAADWYVRAQRRDGGLFRGTYLDFKTDSFGHATSGILCACCLWRDLIAAGQGDKYLEPMKMAFSHAQTMQFRKTRDPNLEGAIIEKILPPDGTDNVPYLIRDLASIFYVQAVALALMDGII